MLSCADVASAIVRILLSPASTRAFLRALLRRFCTCYRADTIVARFHHPYLILVSGFALGGESRAAMGQALLLERGQLGRSLLCHG